VKTYTKESLIAELKKIREKGWIPKGNINNPADRAKLVSFLKENFE